MKMLTALLLLCLFLAAASFGGTTVTIMDKQALLNQCLQSNAINSPACIIIQQQNLYSREFIENQRRIIELRDRQFRYQQERDRQQDEQQKQALREQRMQSLRKNCLENKTLAQQPLCIAIENHYNFGMPVSDEQLGLR